jgi:alpha-L-fucosidase
VVYANVVDWPDENVLELASPNVTTATTVRWLGYPGTLKWTPRAAGGLTIHLPVVSLDKMPCLWAWSVQITGVTN